MQKWEQGRLARSALGPFLSSLPSRNCSTLEGFRAYLSALRPSLHRILAFYGSPKWRNAAFRCYYLRQKLLHDVCHQFRMTGKQTVVFFGAARFNLPTAGPCGIGTSMRPGTSCTWATGWMRTLVPAPSRSAVDKWWEFGGFFFLSFFPFFFCILEY